MHLEILVEDQSGKKCLELLLPSMVNDAHTFKVHSYKGIGRIPKGLKASSDPTRRILLDQLPRLLRGYGKTFARYPAEYKAAVILVCDLDDKCLRVFRKELMDILDACDPRPETHFCFAVEEGEAWFLGDIPAIKAAYPKAKDAILSSYDNDSICGTWELLADAVYQGGPAALSSDGWQAVGREKSQWSDRITPNMEVTINDSPSFVYFREKIAELLEQ